ncbi:hypothetical protein IQ24_02630 [Paracoccus sulfuroxidans]|uniref:Uncharacterized protein n=2 Tax=Paracoccus sulfuroxidans TaxID=384678 RepID=A0A562NKM4_9RHOB|nr:hypothetical protein IQ24_02630 [Paracoccus sulfuroxidans]
MTDRTAALRALIEAVEAGRDEDIDLLACEIWHMDGMCREPLDAYNGSLDAAKALHQALLPGWDYTVGWATGRRHPVASVWPHDDNHAEINVESDTPARAWLICILRACLSQQEAA